MELKKTEKANLENKKGIFVQIGLIVSLAILIFFVENKTYDNQDDSFSFDRLPIKELEEIVVTTQEDFPMPPPPEQKVSESESKEYKIIDDNVEIKQDFTVVSFQQNTNTFSSIGKINVQTDKDDPIDEKVIYTSVEKEASYPGGEEALIKYLSKSLKYPQLAKETGTKGKVVVGFIVERDGSITDIKLIRDIGAGCGMEAKRVVSLMPKWSPAQQKGKPVRQQFFLPITFQLHN